MYQTFLQQISLLLSLLLCYASITHAMQLTGYPSSPHFAGVIKAGSTPVTLTDSSGKVLSAALNTVAVVQGGTGTTTSTGAGSVVLSDTPTLVTPILGVASAISVATSAATPFLLTNGQLVNVALTSQTVGATTLTIPDFASVVDTFAFTTLAQTLANKTLTSPVITNIVPGANFTLTQNSVAAFTSEETGAIANTLYLKAGKASIGTTAAAYLLHLSSSAPELEIQDTRVYSGPTGANVGFTLNTNTGVNSRIAIIGGAKENTTAGNLKALLYFYTHNGTSLAEKMRITSAGSVGIGTPTPPTGGGPALAFAQGTDPTGIAANTAGIYVKDVTGTAELFGFDEAGNFPQLTPHPNGFLNTLPLTNRVYPWAYSAENVYLGKKIQVDMAGLVATVERLSGEKFMYVTDIPKQDWAANQAILVAAQDEKIAALTAQVNALTAKVTEEQDAEAKAKLLDEQSKIVIPPQYAPKVMPAWMQQRLAR